MVFGLTGRCARTTVCVVADGIFVNIIEILYPKLSVIAPVDSSVLGFLVGRPMPHIITPVGLMQIVGVASRTGRTVFGCSYQRIVAEVA